MKIVLLTFAGLPGATILWGFLGAAVLVTLLYILRLRRRRVGVAFLALWERSLLERKASALRSRLQRLISLLISLVLVGALVLALGDPRSDREQEEGRSIAVLLDVSSSMGDQTNGRRRMELAQERIRQWLDGLGAGDELLLIEMGARPRPLGAASSDRELLRSALDQAQVLDVSADLAGGLRLASDALVGRERSQIVIVSDGGLPILDPADFPGLPPVFFESVGQKLDDPGENVGITSFSARRYPLSADRFEILVEVRNSGESSAEVELALYEAKESGQRGQQLDLNRIEIPPQSAISKSYDNLDHAEQGLMAELRRVDGLADPFGGDNVARTLLSERIPAKILVVGPPNNFLDAALLVEESLEVQRVSAEDYPPAGDFDVTIFDGAFPVRNKATGAAFYLGVPGEETGNFPLPLGDELELFGFDTWKEESTLFRLIDPYNIQVLKGQTLVTTEGDVVLGASDGKPILVHGEREMGSFLALGFSPRDSDFVLRAAWPLFLLNVIDELYPRGRTDAVLGLRTGTLWRPPVITERSTVEVVGPLGSGNSSKRVVPVEDGRAVFFGESAGFYEAETEGGKVRFAGSVLSGGEAAFTPNAEYKWADKPLPEVTGMTPRADRKPWFWLLVGVFAISFTEWWLYHRRWTV